MEIEQHVAGDLLDCGAVKVSMDPPFTWTSGIKSPIYCDNRRMISYVKARDFIVDSFIKLIKEHDLAPEMIAGTATAGIPWAAFVAQRMNLPMVYIRSKPKGHGAQKQIEGDFGEAKSCLIVEDLISTGGSVVNAIKAVENETEAEVITVAAIVTYGLAEASQNLGDIGVDVFTLTNFNNIVATAKEKNVIDEVEMEKILQFVQNPRDWYQNIS